MARLGRKPQGAALVKSLGGSDHAKRRMMLFLQTLADECSVVQACQELGLSQSRFFAHRADWLEQSTGASAIGHFAAGDSLTESCVSGHNRPRMGWPPSFTVMLSMISESFSAIPAGVASTHTSRSEAMVTPMASALSCSTSGASNCRGV